MIWHDMISEPYNNFWKYPPWPPKNVIVRGVGGGSRFFVVDWNVILLVTQEPMQSFKFLAAVFMGELAMSRKKKERKKEREKMPFIVATYVYASSQGQRTHSARTNNKFSEN